MKIKKADLSSYDGTVEFVKALIRTASNELLNHLSYEEIEEAVRTINFVHAHRDKIRIRKLHNPDVPDANAALVLLRHSSWALRDLRSGCEWEPMARGMACLDAVIGLQAPEFANKVHTELQRDRARRPRRLGLRTRAILHALAGGHANAEAIRDYYSADRSGIEFVDQDGMVFVKPDSGKRFLIDDLDRKRLIEACEFTPSAVSRAKNTAKNRRRLSLSGSCP